MLITSFNAGKLCEDIVEYIISRDYRVFKELTVERLALKFSVNRSYLSRIFKECRGESLGEYIKRMKLIKGALLLLERRDLTVEQVAAVIGYGRVDYFHISFKEFFAVSPGKFRTWMV